VYLWENLSGTDDFRVGIVELGERSSLDVLGIECVRIRAQWWPEEYGIMDA
jgi:hypothetical protein